MKHLNKRATAIFKRIIENHLKDAEAVKIDNSSFMPLHVDRLVTDVEFCNFIGDVFSLAHYYKQNGDMVPDPDMTFIYIKDPNRVYPLTFQDYRTYQEALFVENGKWVCNPKLLSNLVSFAHLWLKNILYQQGL